MNKTTKTIMSCAGGALLIHFTWFQISNYQHGKDARRYAKYIDGESARQLSTQEMDGYLKKGLDAQRKHVALHRGERAVEGLRIGMSRSEADAVLPNGVIDSADGSIVRYRLSGNDRVEVLARFSPDGLAYAKEVQTGSSSYAFDAGVRYGQTANYNGPGN